MTTQTTTRQPVFNLRHEYLTEHRILWMILAGVVLSSSLSSLPAQAQLCPLPAVNRWCTARQPFDCLATAANETCLPREIMFPSPGATPNILHCDCFTNVPDCGPVDIQPNPIPPGGYTVSCPGPCLPGQACYLHFNGISQGVSSIDSSQIPTGVAVSCGCVTPPPPPVCPVGNSWCVGLQSTDCNTTTINETCLPREVTIDPNTGQVIIRLCDCFSGPGCGPVDIVPNPTIGYTVSCPGLCTGLQTCQVHFNGTPQGVSSIDSSQIPPGTAVTCACALLPPILCPLPASAECAALQSRDCRSAAGECLPKVIRHHIPAVAAFFPPAGTDLLRSTTGYVVIQTPPPNSIFEYYYIRESPPNLTQVIRESPTDVGGHRIITTEIMAMDLVGVAGGGGGGGAVQIRESPTLSSKGRVTGAVSGVTDYPADSFFDLFVEIDIPGLGITGLYNDELTPIPLEAPGIRAVPPLGSSFKTPQGWPGVELLNALGDPTGFVIREVVHELPPPPPPEWEVFECACIDPLACHITRDVSVDPTCIGTCPPWYDCVQRITVIGPTTVDYSCECVPQPEACCFVDGHCEMLRPADCLLIDGTPQGEGTSCLGDHSGNGIDDACETLDHVVCEPQGGVNPTHPNVYWYDVTPQDWGRCDFHVLLVDANSANYTNWTINPWPGNTWQFSVHQLGNGEWWASWYTPACAQPMSPGTTYRLQFNHNGTSTWSHWRTTYTGNNDPYDPFTFDRSQNHPGEPDGYGYRVHVPQPTIQACCLQNGTCVEVEYNKCVALGGDPQGPNTICDMRYCSALKWAQPPTYSVVAPGAQCFWGWDDLSDYFAGPIVADDWACDSNQPITDIHWWGSYQNWTTQSPPPPGMGPNTFHIGIWTDVPAAQPSDETCCYCYNPPGVPPPTTCSPNPPDQHTCDLWGGGQYQQCTYFANSRCMGDHCETILPYSHPGKMIWQSMVPRTQLNERYVGCDQYPGQPSDTCFRYDFAIPQAEWFYQSPSTDPTIYWISISAIPGMPPIQYPWGWKTREHFFHDDAVRIFAPTAPVPGMEFRDGVPIMTPDGESWDMAFVLTTVSPGPSKWDQWPNPDLPGLHAHDGTTLADNWECQGGKVTDFHWWGNYELDAQGNERRGAGIQCINLSIHKNRPGIPWCLPQDPAWGVCAMFDALHERDTGLVNSEGSKIYLYDFYWPGFDQELGEVYWLNIEAQSINALNPALWRWQENSRDAAPRLCPAAERTPFQPWHTIEWAPPPFRYSEMAFRVTSTPYPPGPDPSATAGRNRYLSMLVPPAPSPPGPLTALRVTLIDLQHPVPANLPLKPPRNFTTFDTMVNGVCVGGSYPGHHCDTDADCRLCVGGSNAGRVCTGAANCPSGSCPAGGTCSSLAACTAAGEMNGCARWVGKPGTFLESQDSPGGATNRSARLQCTPYYHDWGSVGVFHVTGAEIVPSSKYEVVSFALSCMGNENTCAAVSPPLPLTTARSGDVAPDFNPPATTTQPNALDVAAVVNKLKNLVGALVKCRSQLQPNLPELNADINALDIVAVVDAVKQSAYAFSGPCACPSAVPCGPAAGSVPCATATPCVTAFGAGAMCVKTCNGGANAGDPCINNSHCPGGGVCGNAGANPGFCRDRCGRCTP